MRTVQLGKSNVASGSTNEAKIAESQTKWRAAAEARRRDMTSATNPAAAKMSTLLTNRSASDCVTGPAIEVVSQWYIASYLSFLRAWLMSCESFLSSSADM